MKLSAKLTLIFAYALSQILSSAQAAVGVPLDLNSNAGSEFAFDADLGNGPLARLATELIKRSCLLVSPTDSDRIQACVGTLSDKLHLSAVAQAKSVPPAVLAAWLSPAYVRDVTELCAFKGVDLDVVSRLMTELLNGLMLNGVQDLKAAQKDAVLNVIRSSGLSAEEISQVVTGNSLLTGAPAVPAAPGLNGLPASRVPGMPGVPGMPKAPGSDELLQTLYNSPVYDLPSISTTIGFAPDVITGTLSDLFLREFFNSQRFNTFKRFYYDDIPLPVRNPIKL